MLEEKKKTTLSNTIKNYTTLELISKINKMTEYQRDLEECLSINKSIITELTAKYSLDSYNKVIENLNKENMLLIKKLKITNDNLDICHDKISAMEKMMSNDRVQSCKNLEISMSENKDALEKIWKSSSSVDQRNNKRSEISIEMVIAETKIERLKTWLKTVIEAFNHKNTFSGSKQISYKRHRFPMSFYTNDIKVEFPNKHKMCLNPLNNIGKNGYFIDSNCKEEKGDIIQFASFK